MRFFRVCAAVITLALAAFGVYLMYDTLASGDSLAVGNVLVGAISCSLSLILFFFIVQPTEK